MTASEKRARKPKRETAQQRNLRVARDSGLEFCLFFMRGAWHVGSLDGRWFQRATDNVIALWRALERSQRALARARGIKS